MVEHGKGDFFTSKERDNVKLDRTTFKLEQFNTEECYTFRPIFWLKKFSKFIAGIHVVKLE